MSETLTRAISGAVYVALLLTACWYSEESFKILIGAFLVMTTIEFSKLVKFNSLVGFGIAIVLYAVFGFFNNIGQTYDMHIAVLSSITGVWLIQKLFRKESLFVTRYFVKYVLFIFYIVFSFIIMVKIPMIKEISELTQESVVVYRPGQIIGIFVLIWVNDSFAYLVGKSIGKHKLFVRVSPKKTIEGFLGGMVFTIVTGVLIGLYFLEEPVFKWVVIAVISVVFSTLGDLIQSKFKRTANVKDSGTIMPGHGGIYDRLDSIIFVAPFVFLFYQFI
ncbi:MAG TPA: phosphatidate cytidylyltransferase [Flavobacterium sp.]|nr:phosphatidate cytidylyltransferase [Flavobacterium sp.]